MKKGDRLVINEQPELQESRGEMSVARHGYLDYLSLLVKEKDCWTTQEARESIKVTFGIDYSPDLNPEEYLWKTMKRELSKDFIKTIDEMKASINKAWHEFPVA